MSHSAELARRMARARISACYDCRAADRFERTEPERLRRIPWESEASGMPWAIDWFMFWDGVVLAMCLVGVALLLLGVIP